MAKDPICGMKVSENSPYKLIKEESTTYFCSKHCLEIYAKSESPSGQSTCCHSQEENFFIDPKVIWLLVGLIFVIIVSYFFSPLGHFRHFFVMYFKKAWAAISLGLIIGGLIDYYVPHKYISYLLARRKKRTIFYSVFLGFFMSVCNHGILAISMELYKKGASTASVIAFLLASPWANLPLTFMLIGFFGFIKAIYIIFSAIIIALITGLIYQILEHRGWVEVNDKTFLLDKDFSLQDDFKKRMKTFRISFKQLTNDLKQIFKSIISLSNMVLWWTILGMTLASLAAAFIPENIFKNYMGPTAFGLIVTLVVATLIEVCSEGMSPLAFEIYRQTSALGNSLVFLMAGVATDYTEIGLIWQNIGRRAAIALPLITVPQIICWGLLANIIF